MQEYLNLIKRQYNAGGISIKNQPLKSIQWKQALINTKMCQTCDPILMLYFMYYNNY